MSEASTDRDIDRTAEAPPEGETVRGAFRLERLRGARTAVPGTLSVTVPPERDERSFRNPWLHPRKDYSHFF
jgi:hypothetical protein